LEGKEEEAEEKDKGGVEGKTRGGKGKKVERRKR
jgi:hypothetical protein